tara:strand:+ start:49 stop:474 length:426 start_codon:yes stop_codon:yes gene_type:complete
MDSFDLKKYLAEGKLHEVNQPYEIISKKTEKSPYSDKIQDSYTLKIFEEDYTTPEGLTFKLLTQGYVLVEKDQEIDFDSTHHFYYIKTTISDEEGNWLEQIPGRKVYGFYDVKSSINKAKRWLDKRGSQLMGGKGYQHKST